MSSRFGSSSTLPFGGSWLISSQLGTTRDFVSSIGKHIEAAGQGDADAIRVALDHGEYYIELLRNHILKEDNILFNMADGLLHGPELEGLTASYGEAQAKPEYCAKMERCRAIAEEMTARYGVAAP